MTYNILEIIFIALALLVMGIFAVLQSRARRKYRKELRDRFDHEGAEYDTGNDMNDTREDEENE